MPTGEYVMKSFHLNKTDLKAAAINLVRNLPITIEYMAAATLVSTIFFHFSNNVTNISIIYTLAIIMIARATSCYGAGILASLFGVFWVNFAFTYPYLTLNFTMSGYPITFLGMALISSLSSSICIMITKQNVQLQEKDRMLLLSLIHISGTSAMMVPGMILSPSFTTMWLSHFLSVSRLFTDMPRLI